MQGCGTCFDLRRIQARANRVAHKVARSLASGPPIV